MKLEITSINLIISRSQINQNNSTKKAMGMKIMYIIGESIKNKLNFSK